ncbi:SMEK domain-containing protein [Eubacterium aggregans]|uniref:SMEK domain-containing protein n=1 Tax=Eubacterium aggregans TaxID=81409 RepID=UPI003F3001CA
MSVFKKEEYFIGITNAIGILCSRVSLENTLHLFNTNTIAEDFFASLLNLIHGWNLNNVNAEEMNASAIDLADPVQKIAVQVTV